MDLFQAIKNYEPVNEQEVRDKEVMLQYIASCDNYLERENKIAHFTVSIWTVNKAHTKTLMAYHNIYDSWAWIGGHADGEADLPKVALRELEEETGVQDASLVSTDIFSLEILTVDGHVKKGSYVPSHLHLNVTYLAEADESEELTVNEAENQAVKWWTFEDVLKVSKEPWFVERIYKKLIEKCKKTQLCANGVTLCPMTRDMCHAFYKGFRNDPAIFMDMSRYREYEYSRERVDRYFDEQQSPSRRLFAILADGQIVGECKLKSIDDEKRECSIGIHLLNDTVKEKGYGTQAERLLLQYAFEELGMVAVNADVVLKNTRSQHVLEKVGFRFIGEDESFKYYQCVRDSNE